MFRQFKAFYIKQLFIPNAFSIFFNPFFIIRWHLLRAIRQFAPRLKGNLLDFGCGSKPYRSLFPHVGQYTGVDIENEGHPHENEAIDVFYDGRHLPFSDAHFDSVLCSEVLEHVPNPDEIITEIHRVMKPQGKILITIPFVWDEHETPHDYRRLTSFGTRQFLEQAGFEIIEQQKTAHFAAVIAQLTMLYLHNVLFTKNKYLNLLINLVFISPVTITGSFLAWLLPRNRKLYFNNVVLAQKPDN